MLAEGDDEALLLGQIAELRHLRVDLGALGQTVDVEHQRQRLAGGGLGDREEEPALDATHLEGALLLP